MHKEVVDEAQAFVDQTEEEGLNLLNVGKVKVTPD
jgi:hypothetical protein